MDRIVLAVEAGGTKFEIGRFEGNSTTASTRARVVTSDPATTLPALGEAIVAVCGGRGPDAVGLASFGPIERGTGRLGATPKPGWSGFALGDALRGLVGDVPVAIETDVAAAALGEARFGAGVGLSSIVYLTVGTGIGGGHCVDGELLPGPFHEEMGHLRPARADREFAGVCPFHGDCLEGLCSGVALTRRWGRPPEELEDDHPAWPIWAADLAQGIAAIALVTACERVVLGGGVGIRSGPRRLLTEALVRGDGGYLPDRPAARGTLIVAPLLGDASALVGAATLARARLERGDR